MISKKSIVIIISLSVFAVFMTQVAIFSQVAEASHPPTYDCTNPGTYTTYCYGKKSWCSNADRAPPLFACGCTCTTASCQDGSYLTYNSCGSDAQSRAVCSSNSCSSGSADANNNPSDGCETNTNTDEGNCGTVGNVCSSGQECQSGTCVNPIGFGIGLDPSLGIANPGDTKNVNATLTLTSGSGTASFSATGVPTGTTVTFTPTSCSPTCYSNMSVATTGSTPVGSSLITVTGTSGSVTSSSVYNLTIFSNSTPATCGAPTTCDYGETQANCASDCSTSAGISPSTVTPGEIVTVTVEFRDFRYAANGKVRIDMTINPEGTVWNAANGCFFGGIKLGPTSTGGATAWPSGTTSENGYFRISTSCTMPGTIGAGAHTLVATPTIF